MLKLLRSRSLKNCEDAIHAMRETKRSRLEAQQIMDQTPAIDRRRSADRRQQERRGVVIPTQPGPVQARDTRI